MIGFTKEELDTLIILVVRRLKEIRQSIDDCELDSKKEFLEQRYSDNKALCSKLSKLRGALND